MITGKLVKFEPTNEGVTVMIKCNDDQMAEIVAHWKKQVTVGEPSGENQSPDAALKSWVINRLERVLAEVAGLPVEEKPELFEGEK